jgi:site-specific DNA-methyltransferase (adenine-specific)
LIFTKGNYPRRLNNKVSQVILSEKERHSKKPDEARKRIVELMGDLPRIELFARQYAEGWDCWGNEV